MVAEDGIGDFAGSDEPGSPGESFRTRLMDEPRNRRHKAGEIPVQQIFGK